MAAVRVVAVARAGKRGGEGECDGGGGDGGSCSGKGGGSDDGGSNNCSCGGSLGLGW